MTRNAFAACSMGRHPYEDKDGAQSHHKWCLRQREEGSSRLRRAEEEHAAAVICLSLMGICRERRQDGELASKSLFLQYLGLACICLEYNWTWAGLQTIADGQSCQGCCSLHQPLCLFAAAHTQSVTVNCERTLKLAWCCRQTQRSQQIPMISLVHLK